MASANGNFLKADASGRRTRNLEGTARFNEGQLNTKYILICKISFKKIKDLKSVKKLFVNLCQSWGCVKDLNKLCISGVTEAS